jgi:hypothetical protein
MPAPIKFPRPKLQVCCVRADEFGHLRVGQTYTVRLIVEKYKDHTGEHDSPAYVLADAGKNYAWDVSRFEGVRS